MKEQVQIKQSASLISDSVKKWVLLKTHQNTLLAEWSNCY